MTLAQGFIARKLLRAIGSEAITSMATLASTPLPSFNSSIPSLSVVNRAVSSTTPYDNTSRIKSLHTNIVIITVFVVLFFATLLSAHIRRCYLCHNPGRATTIMPSYYCPPSPPRGLDNAILETLPKVVFSSTTVRQKMQMECVICLEEFKDEQTLHILPHCGHGFHPECIHMWLFSHTTCPLCRHSLLFPLKPSAPSFLTEVAAYDSAGIGGVTLIVDQQPSMPLRVQNPAAAAATAISIILVEAEAVANPNGGESKPSLLQQMKPRRSHSMGHFPTKEELATCSSSLPPPQQQSSAASNFRHCRSYTMLCNQGRES